MDKKQVQEAIGRIDNALAQLAINRQGHIILTNDLQLVQQCCTEYFSDKEAAKAVSEKKDGGTNIIPIHPKPGDKDK